ncbi:MAG: ATP-binding protein [Gallionella sp.]
MKFPRTLLARSFLLIVGLIFLSLSSALAIFNQVEQEPRARQMAQLVVSVVNLTRAAILSSAPEWHTALLAELGDAEGLRVSMAEPNDVLTPLPEHPYELHLMKQKVSASLGASTRFAIQRNHIHALWVSFYIGHEEFWVAVPIERIEHGYSEALLIWGGVVVVLALLGSYLIARQVARPLHRLAYAAEQLGRGVTPPALPDNSAQEFTVVSRAFNQMAADINAHERERALVLAGISHDLRTPLTRVRLAAEMSSDEILRDGLVTDVEQMDEIIKQFLDYARLDENEPPTTTDVSALVHEVAQRHISPTQAIELDIQHGLNFCVRPLLLKRALGNLLDNAVKYGRGQIAVQLKQDGGRVKLSVSDNGIGIAPDQRDLAKRPFVRLQAARSDTTGSGLGLAIVERAAKMHGGELVLGESAQGGLLATLILQIKSA